MLFVSWLPSMRRLEKRTKTSTVFAKYPGINLTTGVFQKFAPGRLNGKFHFMKLFLEPNNRPKLDCVAVEVMWSDESRFTLFQFDGRVRVWREPHEAKDPSCTTPTL